MILNRNRMWEVPVVFQNVMGALVARLTGDRFAVYRERRWDIYSISEMEARFTNKEILGCDVGGWMILDRLNYTRTNDGYAEPWHASKLDLALRQAVPILSRGFILPSKTEVRRSRIESRIA